MSDPEVVRTNARVKLWSSFFVNLGSALVAADAYRVFVEQKVDPTTGSWTIVAAILIWTGHALLRLLEAES